MRIKHKSGLSKIMYVNWSKYHSTNILDFHSTLKETQLYSITVGKKISGEYLL